MSKKSLYLTLLFFFLASFSLMSQGSFFITNYSNEDYKGFRQNWAIAQDSNGLLYFGNNLGLFWFDGVKWGNTHVSDKTILYSLLSSSDGDIFYGTEKSFGLIVSDSLSNRTALNFNELVKDNQKQASIVRRIQEKEGLIYFQSSDFIYVYDGSKIEVIHNESKFGQLVKAGDRLFVRLIGKGLAEIKGTSLFLIDESIFANIELYTGSQVGDKIIFGTRNEGLKVYKNKKIENFSGPLQDFLKGKWIYRSITLSDEEILFVTINNGLIIVNINESTHYTINKEAGLPTNQTYSAFLDIEKNLWVAHDQGISKVSLFNPVIKNTDINVSFIEELNSEIYFGGTSGLYKIINDSTFLILNDRIYSLDKIDNNLIINSSNGLYRLKESESNIELISDEGGFYDLRVARNGESFKIYLSKEETLFIKEFNSSWKSIFEKKIEIRNSTRFIEVYGNDFWITTNTDTLIRFRNNFEIQEKYKLDISENTEIRALTATSRGLFIGTDEGLFIYNSNLDSLVRQSIINDNDQANKQVYRIEECSNGQFWFQYDRQIHKLYSINENYRIVASPFQQIGEQEHINSIKCFSNNVIFGGANGLYTLSNPEWEYDQEFTTNITDVYVRNDSLVYGGYGEPTKSLVFPFKNNALRFTYAATSYIDPTRNTYSYKLEGFDSQWSSWSLETQKDYTNIPEGTYIFKVKSRNVYEYEGSTDTFTFTILPPWYRSWWAYCIYVFLFFGTLYLVYKIRLNQILKVQRVRNRIADDLHDDLSGTLIGISNFAKAISSNTDSNAKDRFLGLIEKSADEAKEKISDIVWTINPEHDDWLNFLTKCRRYASDIFESQKIEYSLEMDESIPKGLEMELRKNLWLIFKEILTNITKHSKANYVLVRFKFDHNKLRIFIKDNGVGFDIDDVRNGNGMKSIKRRVESIDGEVELISGVDNGTSWEIEIDT